MFCFYLLPYIIYYFTPYLARYTYTKVALQIAIIILRRRFKNYQKM